MPSSLANRSRAPHIARVAPVLFSSTTVTYGNDSLTTNITGSTQDIQQVLNLEIQEGTFFSESQLSARASVIVIGPQAAERLTGASKRGSRNGAAHQWIPFSGYRRNQTQGRQPV